MSDDEGFSNSRRDPRLKKRDSDFPPPPGTMNEDDLYPPGIDFTKNY